MNTKSNSPKPTVVAVFRRGLRVLEREIVRQLETDTGCCGVTVAQCHTLLELAESELSLTRLAAALELDSSTLSRTVDVLVRAGLLDRNEDASDRRSLRLTLTPAGRAKVEVIDGVCNRYYGELLAGMGPQDQRCVLRAVGLLSERMRNLRTGPSCAKTGECNGNE